MKSPFAFDGVLVFGWLSLMLLAGVFMRANLRLLQRFLFPACLIGGILGLALEQAGIISIGSSTLEACAYHLFNISFISIGLTAGPSDSLRSAEKSGYLKGAGWMALVQTVCFTMQGALSGVMVVGLGLMGYHLFPTFGFLVPLGFEEGPGQALSVGKVWESFGFTHAATIGLTFAAMGFFFAFFVGVPLVNWGIRKGFSTAKPRTLPQSILSGFFPRHEQTQSAGMLTLYSGNIDTLSFQTAVVGLAYLIAYGLIRSLGSILPDDAARILWGFCFIVGLVTAICMRKVMGYFGFDHLIHPDIQRRITGWAVDFLIVATVMAIQLTVVWQFIGPILLIGIVNGMMTTLLLIYLGRRLSAYNLERTAALYGTATGTVSSGLLLLRIADPQFLTPVAIEIALMNVLSILPIGICMMLVNAPIWWGWRVATTALLFFGIMVLGLTLIRRLERSKIV